MKALSKLLFLKENNLEKPFPQAETEIITEELAEIFDVGTENISCHLYGTSVPKSFPIRFFAKIASAGSQTTNMIIMSINEQGMTLSVDSVKVPDPNGILSNKFYFKPSEEAETNSELLDQEYFNAIINDHLLVNESEQLFNKLSLVVEPVIKSFKISSDQTRIITYAILRSFPDLVPTSESGDFYIKNDPEKERWELLMTTSTPSFVFRNKDDQSVTLKTLFTPEEATMLKKTLYSIGSTNIDELTTLTKKYLAPKCERVIKLIVSGKYRM
jgi:hypothetical protein